MVDTDDRQGVYEAMARRYRPRSFDQVVGQEHVAQTLKNAIEAKRVAHAYLFCGPHGCGKTSMARIFACALVCENGPTPQPCGKCPICTDVLRGQDVDVQEIDGASNNGVEQVRALREQAGYIPSRARYKIYIIDEVHMLSVAAFNALLKTLEEPPAHVKFILATTDPHKIIGTILSRCQRFDFRLVPPVKMSAFFKDLVEKEDAEITEEALDAVAAFSGGSVRDGLVLLDQLVSYSQGKVTREDVERVRGVAGAEVVAGLFESIVSHDISRALSLIDEVARRGTNSGDFLDQLIEFGRDLMLVSATGKTDAVTAYGPARNVLLDLANAVALDQALLMLDVFAQARTRVRSRALSNPLVPLEMAVARLAGIENLEPVGDLIKKLDAYARGAPPPQNVVSGGSRAPAIAVSAEEKPAHSEKENQRSVEKNKNDVDDYGMSVPLPVDSVEDEEDDDSSDYDREGLSETLDNKQVWMRIMRLLSERSKPDMSLLNDVYIDRIEEGKLFLSVPGGGSFIFEQLEDSRRKSRIADCAHEVLGKKVTVHLVVRDSISEKSSAPKVPPVVIARKEAQSDPGVRMVVNNFDGEIIDIEE